jgi:glutamate/tyrosine decarboxylase-like PLP-dependent enzyme
MQAIDQVDGLKSSTPMLGEQGLVLDFAAAKKRRLDEHPAESLESVTSQLVQYLSGCYIWGHPKAQIHVVAPPTIAGIIGGLLPSIYNPNLVSDEYSRHVAIAEVEASSMIAHLVGYDPEQSAGVFTFGGTGTLLYGAKIGLEKACPGTSRSGMLGIAMMREHDAGNDGTTSTSSSSRSAPPPLPPVLVCSDRAHYATRTVASWLGMGQHNVIVVPTRNENDMDVAALEKVLGDLAMEGRKIACIVATLGTTDAFGLDDLEQIVQVRDRFVRQFEPGYVPHVHADAVIGWAWSVFNDYDFERNELGFRGRTVRALAGTRRRIQHLSVADSLGVDFHKTGFAPYTSSLFLCKSSSDVALIARDPASMPYLFKSGRYHPGKYTLETSRGGGGPMSALASLLLLGKSGLRSLLGHVVTVAGSLAEKLESHECTTVVNRGNFGPVTLFRVYPDGVDTFSISEKERTDPSYREQLLEHNEYNRQIYRILEGDALQGRGVVVSLTECYRETDYGEPIVALKSYVLSPFSDGQYVDAVLASLWAARDRLVAKSSQVQL